VPEIAAILALIPATSMEAEIKSRLKALIKIESSLALIASDIAILTSFIVEEPVKDATADLMLTRISAYEGPRF
jgi:hypothetical protein